MLKLALGLPKSIPFWRKPKAPIATLSADRTSVVLTMPRALLEGSQDGRALLARFAGGEGSGDWGGADYGEERLSAETIANVISALH